MEIPLDSFRAVSKAINRYLDERQPDNILTAALLSAVLHDEVDADEPSLVAWRTSEGRCALLAVQERIIQATVVDGASSGEVSIRRRADVQEVVATQIDRPEGFGTDIDWQIRHWTVKFADGHQVELGTGAWNYNTTEHVARLMRSLIR